jgi:parvulin-like peptidyl-prolyl isomerase
MMSRSQIRLTSRIAGHFVSLFLTVALVAPIAADESKASATDDEPVAIVDNVTIRRAAVKRILADKLPNLSPKKIAEAEAAAVETIVRQRLALARLVAKKQGASDADVDHEVQLLKERLKPLGITLESHLKELDLSQEELRFDLRWRLSWSAFLLEKLTDENLKKYFDAHRADFDGTKVHAAHILFACPAEDAALRKTNRKEAEVVKRRITEGEISFSDAAKKYSAAPTAANGGDIGLIERHQPMPESFNAAAFALKVGETSEPIETTFGVHLIHCLGIEAGKKSWESARTPLRAAVTRYLFDTLVEQQRSESKIEYLAAPKSQK